MFFQRVCTHCDLHRFPVSIHLGKPQPERNTAMCLTLYHKKQRPNGYAGQYSLADSVKTAGKNYITAHFGKGMTEKLKMVNYDVTDEYEKYAPNGNLHRRKIDIPTRRNFRRITPSESIRSSMSL
ncbi:MAG: hypothetical protein CM15mP130_2070 [Verrucomicrobiota bacterium]|nr:MAG: hypothetical protein CM15mP130_2070 [Verrucomicrobiota bacterium]